MPLTHEVLNHPCTHHSAIFSHNHPAIPPTSQPACRSAIQPISQPVPPSASQSLSQPISQPVRCFHVFTKTLLARLWQSDICDFQHWPDQQSDWQNLLLQLNGSLCTMLVAVPIWRGLCSGAGVYVCVLQYQWCNISLLCYSMAFSNIFFNMLVTNCFTDDLSIWNYVFYFNNNISDVHFLVITCVASLVTFVSRYIANYLMSTRDITVTYDTVTVV